MVQQRIDVLDAEIVSALNENTSASAGDPAQGTEHTVIDDFDIDDNIFSL